MDAVSTTFPKTRRNRLGYDIEQVEDFLEDARRAYTAERGEISAISAWQIRETAFAMKKGGYSPEAVDAALERLEDAFAMRERQRLAAQGGEAALLAEKREVAQEIVDRLSRPAGERFARVSLLARGYRRHEVDALAERIFAYLTRGAPLEVSDIRSAAFHPQRGGYREAQVDMLLDAVIEIIRSVE
ncbi:DivIVA domain-containing protein [Salinibacterium sp. SYSU T00001]|uniref:DivIVA domain-containing protein n=1 Tax=Homoserinimonas sedimenticola TaxID=2986805 RepID=UPI002235B99B|nr:DivIVA domain-containing protein [Salinibacterium sedimenticola]MCW4384832.1 DivIVA domain-containing protein [Salinibacterium sedimenticola]